MSSEHRTSAWVKARSIARPRLQAQINSGSGWCFDGRHVIAPGTAWDVSHIVSVQAMKAQGMSETEMHAQSNLTSSCRKHNRSVGGKAGAEKQNRARRIEAGGIDEW